MKMRRCWKAGVVVARSDQVRIMRSLKGEEAWVVMTDWPSERSRIARLGIWAIVMRSVDVTCFGEMRRQTSQLMLGEEMPWKYSRSGREGVRMSSL